MRADSAGAAPDTNTSESDAVDLPDTTSQEDTEEPVDIGDLDGSVDLDGSGALDGSAGLDGDLSEEVSTEDTSMTDTDTSDAPDVGEVVLCPSFVQTPPDPRGAGTSPGAVSPFGTGLSSDVILGSLKDPGVVAPSVAPGLVSTNIDLEAVTYDVYVPEDYDGTQPYGLIAFINSGNNGGGPTGSYLPQLDQDQLIQIAPDGAGNNVNVDVRMGRALIGALRAMEIFNIDETRVYGMGSSGGARASHMLAYQHPQLFTAVLPRCGANYPREVLQAYETREPDSHYEFWGDYFPIIEGRPYIDHLRDQNLRFSLMTSDGDFREGDIMNGLDHRFAQKANQ